MDDKKVDVMEWRVAPFFNRIYAAGLDFFLLYTGVEYANQNYSGIGLIIFLLTVVFQLLKFRRSTSLGKDLFALKVVKKGSVKGIGFFPMLFREIPGKILSAGLAGIGIMWIVADRDYQGWHDKLVGSVVMQFTGN
ncbi:MAG: RDD family protein [Halanaerobiaceae bacterium]